MTASDFNGKKAITNYKTIKVFNSKDIPKISLIECKLETGRTHQIRVHMQYKGTSLLGDKQYGKKNIKFKKINKDFENILSLLSGQTLHAKSLGFKHPINNNFVSFDSKIPTKFKKLLNLLEKHDSRKFVIYNYINIHMSDKEKNINLPSPSVNGLSIYLVQIKKFPMLDAEEEYMLAKNWRESGNLKAAHKLVTSHLRLVAKIAMGYRGYGLPVNELISEGNIGLMQAVKKFDPEKGFRLATYAMWWIKAAIQEYVLRSWSLVKMGTTTAQKKLFFNLKKLKRQIAPEQEGDLRDEHVAEISKRLNVNSKEVVNMNRRMMSQEKSLNDPIKVGETDEWQDWLVDENLDQELAMSQQQEFEDKKDLLNEAIGILSDREREIIKARRLAENPKTLEELSKKYKISRERIRQIETKAFEKLQKMMINSRKSKNLLPAN